MNLNWLDKHYRIKKNQCTGIEDYDFIESLNYNDNSNILSFVIKHFHKEPKITRYVQNNYQRTPIYGDYKIKTSTLKKFNKVINLIRFLEDDIFKLNLDSVFLDEITYEILSKTNNKYVPSWLKKRQHIENIEYQINLVNNEINKLKEENNNLYNTFSKTIEDYENSKKNFEYTKLLPKKNNSIWILLFGILLVPFLFLGVYICNKYVSKNKALSNIEKENKAKIEMINLQNQLNIAEKEFKNKSYLNNIKIEKEKNNIIFFNQKIQEVNQKDYRKVETENGFINLRQSSNLIFSEEIKGVYIIWNKTKNKYYVGQSKDIYKRLFRQHFINGEVNNIVFAKDWYNGDDFFYKLYPCKTKDELDNLEKQYISEYNSFEFGYNKTSGNK